MMFSRLKFSIILLALPVVLKFTARRHPAFAARLKQRNLIAQIKARDERIGRWISIRDGKISSGRGMHAKPDVTLSFKNATIGASLLTPPINWLNQINAQKDFNARRRRSGGPDQLVRADPDDDADRRLEIRHAACPTAPCAIAT